jgi:hypothetical protein
MENGHLPPDIFLAFQFFVKANNGSLNYFRRADICHPKNISLPHPPLVFLLNEYKMNFKQTGSLMV